MEQLQPSFQWYTLNPNYNDVNFHRIMANCTLVSCVALAYFESWREAVSASMKAEHSWFYTASLLHALCPSQYLPVQL